MISPDLNDPAEFRGVVSHNNEPNAREFTDLVAQPEDAVHELEGVTRSIYELQDVDASSGRNTPREAWAVPKQDGQVSSTRKL